MTSNVLIAQTISDKKHNLKRACNHLERVARTARDILEKPMSITELARELEFLHKQSSLAYRRINDLFMENTDLGERMTLGREYGQL